MQLRIDLRLLARRLGFEIDVGVEGLELDALVIDVEAACDSR